MYYMLYLSSLCRRRRWPDPLFESYQTSTGFCCMVRVNHREYQTDTVYESEVLARENAAMRAYLICRNFSVNDGRYPTGLDKGGQAGQQGVPVAIGTGRRSTYESSSSSSEGAGSAVGYASRESSPRSSDGGHGATHMARSLAYGSTAM